jgi:hypothetical protein
MRIFFTSFILTLLIGVTMAIPPFIYLLLAGEYDTAEEVTNSQRSNTEVIFGSALRGDENYKLTALAKLRPKIVALGSSRVMQFRQHSFNQEFLNLGGLMSSIHDGHEAAEAISSAGAEVVLIGADIWWFNEAYQKPQAYRGTKKKPYEPNLVISDLYRLIGYGLEGKLTWDIWNPNIGLAGKKGDGFGNDGFRHYTSSVTGTTLHKDAQFADTFSRIEKGTSRFEYGSTANQEHMKNFKNLITRLEKQGAEVVVFIPPLASQVNDKMDSLGDSYDYIKDLRKKFASNNIDFFDYTHANLIGSNDCEFLDGFHGGEVTYMRILRDIALKNPKIAKVLDTQTINQLIEKNHGLATSTKEFANGGREIDFLELGCKKGQT